MNASRSFIDDTRIVVDGINAMAAELAPELLPNGRRAGNKWMFSGIPDNGKTESAWVNLNTGFWCDAGNCAVGEEKGDMLDLLRLKLGLADKRAAFEEARQRLGLPCSGDRRQLTQEEKQRREREARERALARERSEQAERVEKAKKAKGLWLSGVPIEGTGGDAYFRWRGLEPGPTGKWPNSFRFKDLIWHDPSRRKHPAIVAAVYHPGGEYLGTHRIYLERFLTGWRGITVPDHLPKKEQRGYRKRILGNQWGGFIPINKGSSNKGMAAMPEGERIYICEGPEDAVAIRMIKPEARIICSINLGNIGQIVLPERAGELVIVADRDTGENEVAGLERVVAQQQARGMKCAIVMPPQKVNGQPVKDINDWVRALARKEAA